jgi:phosphate transport system ATP-binding protein
VTTQMPVTAPTGPTASRLAPPISAAPSGPPPSGPPRSMTVGDRPDAVHGGGSRVPASGPPPTTPPRLPSLPRPGGAGEPERQRFSLRGRPAASTMADIVPPDTALAGIDARNISAWFGSHQVLDRVSLDMEAGKVTALIGPSGCGKSTFLRILNRMHEMIPGAQMGGEVLVDGHDIYDPERKLTDARREVGMVFQKPNPFPAMSIYDNVLASFRLTGVKATTELKDEIVESCLAKAGLWNEVKDRLRQPGGGLSGGQQQRLCIARALSIKPRVLLMDEPCSALDPTSTRRIEETIMQIVSEVTIVIVTHNMQQAARVSNHCAFFLAEQGTPGLIVEHGPTDAMFGDPQDPRTSDYVLGRFG